MVKEVCIESVLVSFTIYSVDLLLLTCLTCLPIWGFESAYVCLCFMSFYLV